jgi:tol-pal system protein YbgF
MQEMQRDVAQLQQQVKDLQSSFDQKMASVLTLMQQTFDTASKANTAVNVLDSGVREKLRDQIREALGPVGNLGNKIDGMSQDVSYLKTSVDDLTQRMGRLEQQMKDLKTAVSTMPAPSGPPPPTTSGGSSTDISGTSSSGPPPVPSAVLYQNAVRDLNGGKYDLALSEFQDYLKWFGKDDMAPNAQFHLGSIHYAQGNMEQAIQDFDAVLERYQTNLKTPDAYFMKGQALVRTNQRNKAVKEFNLLIEKFPRSDQAAAARAQLKALGMNPPAGSGATARKRR